ncbi:MAG: DUF1501 domain-containing protein, partial [Planctomycetaceae bacterium]|nr:DUF1501 domain-containing protein [Planctomycetaceae bacterium]
MINQHHSRRDFLSWTGHGLGSAALATLLLQEGTVSAGQTPPQARDPWPHFEAPAKRVIHICACGGVSQVDSFDYKPTLEKYHGQKYGGIDAADVFFGQIGLLRQSDWKFRQRG